MKGIIKENSKNIKSMIKGKSTGRLIHSVTAFHKNTDAMVKALKIQDKSLRFDCRKGCSTCCKLRVEILPPEAFLIAEHIELLQKEERDRIVNELEVHAEYAAGKTFSDYLISCPFLSKDGACNIYDIRPFKCRKYFSKQIEACEETRNANEDSKLKMFSDSLADKVVDIYKSKGLVMHPAELGQSVLKSIKDPLIKDRWAKGEQVFDLLPERIML